MTSDSGSVDIYVAKLAQADGSVVWAKRFGGSGEDLVTGLAVNEQDEIFLSGSINGPHDYGGGPLPHAGARDILLLKLSATGDFGWAKSFGTSGYDQGTAVAARNGQVALGGYFNAGTLDVADTSIPSQGTDDIVIALFSSSQGDLVWAKGFGGTSSDKPETMRIDSSGNVVAAGEFQATVNFGMGSVTAMNRDVFLLKLGAASGNALVAKTFGGDDVDTASAVDVDDTDAMYLAGSFKHTVNFGTGDVTASSTTNSDAYLVKLSAAGATVWAKPYGGTGNTRRATSVAISLTNDVVFAGGFSGELSLGGATLSSASGSAEDVFLARAAAGDGSYVSSTRAGGQGQESASSVTQTSDGKYFVTGSFQGFADFGGTALTSAGSDDAFIFAMAPL